MDGFWFVVVVVFMVVLVLPRGFGSPRQRDEGGMRDQRDRDHSLQGPSLLEALGDGKP